ncbi:MAG: HlyC/CorC family transporter [Bdellovibrionales bacterium]|nr:HlyC/CorC family transporter [Bdellovibrionales bacterium]
MDIQIPLYLLLLSAAVLLVLNGLFAAAEFAVLHSNPVFFEAPERRERRSSRAAAWLLKRLDVSLTATELGMTLTSLLLGWITVRLSLVLFGFASANGLPDEDLRWMYGASAVLALAFVALAHLVLGELVAKSLAIRYPEQTLRFLAPPILFFVQVARPILFVATRLSNAVLGMFGTSVPATAERVHSVSDLSRIVSQGTEQGVFDEDEENMLRGVFGFSETVAREVMTPRTDLVALDVNATLADVIATINQSGFSRFPVKGNGIDDIHGILLAKDLLAFMAKEGAQAGEKFHPSKLMRQAYFIPGTKPIDDLLNELKKRKLHMAIVLDEHGGVDGLVTLEDLLEEIVGDIYDESDIPEPTVVEEENGDVVVDGGVLVADLNTQLDLDISEGDYDTIAGFIFTSLGGMPEDGDKILLRESGRLEVALAANSPDDDLPFAVRPFVNGSHSSTDGRDTDQESEETEDPPKLLITVEKVLNHRIETVRLRRLALAEEGETQTQALASQS